MLTKLMKYELKATSRLLVPLYIIVIFLSIINRFAINMDNPTGILLAIRTLIILAYGASIFLALAVTAFYMIVRFYKNFLTDEGYLMFTLPVSSHQLIISKLIIASFWIILSVILLIPSLLIVFSAIDTLPSIMDLINEAILGLTRQFGSKWILVAFQLFIILLLSLFSKILLVYVSIAIGQLFSKHKLIGSFLSYAVINAVIPFLTIYPASLYGRILIGNNPNSLFMRPEVIFTFVIAALLVSCIIFYLGTNYIFKRKLNLD